MNQRRHAENVVKAAHERHNRVNPNQKPLPTNRVKIRKLARDYWSGLSEDDKAQITHTLRRNHAANVA